ncbi:hypothetical protein ACJJIL_07275 [Microbulbifer sp. EKSA005]|uniref:hypothetical protein n=1 Tax=Microbulbifer sp. EKSA005 TaxID=3243364 RepID=UPI0040418421
MKKISIFIFTTLLALSGQTNAKNALEGGEKLLPGQKLLSNNGKYELRMQTGGNLAVNELRTNSNSGETWSTNLWSSNTGANPNSEAVLQRAGNFVIYSTSGKALWAAFKTGKSEYANSRLIMQDDGNLVLYKSDGGVIWHTDTANTPQTCTTKYIDMWGGGLQYGSSFPSEYSCKAQVPLLPSPDDYWAPGSGAELCVISPSYAGKYPQSVCE